MNFNRRSDDLMRYGIVVHRERNLTQRPQREEGTELTEKKGTQEQWSADSLPVRAHGRTN
jgi:hypothetical protein